MTGDCLLIHITKYTHTQYSRLTLFVHTHPGRDAREGPEGTLELDEVRITAAVTDVRGEARSGRRREVHRGGWEKKEREIRKSRPRIRKEPRRSRSPHAVRVRVAARHGAAKRRAAAVAAVLGPATHAANATLTGCFFGDFVTEGTRTRAEKGVSIAVDLLKAVVQEKRRNTGSGDL
jgi:hypothetical protein